MSRTFGQWFASRNPMAAGSCTIDFCGVCAAPLVEMERTKATALPPKTDFMVPPHPAGRPVVASAQPIISMDRARPASIDACRR